MITRHDISIDEDEVNDVIQNNDVLADQNQESVGKYAPFRSNYITSSTRPTDAFSSRTAQH